MSEIKSSPKISSVLEEQMFLQKKVVIPVCSVETLNEGLQNF